MDLPPAPDVLSQPTRASLFSTLNESRRPVSTEALAEGLGLHVNGVRRHLEVLVNAGLVDRLRTKRGRGRPRDEWAISARATPGGEPPRAYADLSEWLARAIPTGPKRLREVERTGRKIGREIAPAEAERSADGFRKVLTALGFQPKLTVDADGTAHCRLCNCPYRDSVRKNSAAICTLHRGITAGLLDELAPGAKLSTFEPHDPDRAGCLVEVVDTSWVEETAQPDQR
jgi:predicted ArsR family transcriptional regulator